MKTKYIRIIGFGFSVALAIAIAIIGTVATIDLWNTTYSGFTIWLGLMFADCLAVITAFFSIFQLHQSEKEGT